MKPSAKIVVPEIIDIFFEFYKKNGYNWGDFYLVLGTSNINDYCADLCMKKAIESKNQKSIDIGNIVIQLSPTQRLKISKICFKKQMSGDSN